MANLACTFLAVFGLCNASPNVQDNVVTPPVPLSQELELIPDLEPEPTPPPPPKKGVLAVRPLSLDFGPLMEGSDSKKLTVTLQNTGDGDLALHSVRKNSPALVLEDTCPPILAPSTTCGVTLSLSTLYSGLISDKLAISGGDNQNFKVNVSGNIIALPEPEPEPTIEPKEASVEEAVILEETFEPAPTPPAFNRQDLLLQLARQKRYAYRPVSFKSRSYGAGLNATDSVSSPVPRPEKWRFHDDDYEGIGIAKTEVGFPVDRCRTITEDNYIDASIENSVNSMIGGRIIAVVSYPIMSSECDYVLIEPGTTIIGEFQELGENNITRLEIAWRRMILPDGSSMIFDFAAADVEGKTGLQGVLDDRRREKYGTIFAISAINLGLYGAAQYFQSLSETTGQTVAQINNDTSSQLGDVTASIIQQQLLIKNVLRLHKRMEIKIIPTIDLWFPEPELVKG